MPDSVTVARFGCAFRSVEGKARLWSMLEVKGEDQSGAWEWSSWLEGDLAALCRMYHRQELPIGVLLDRLEECPEEAGGGSVPALAVAWLRRRYDPASTHSDG